MTDHEIDQRIRAIETWSATHDEKCKGRHESILRGIESVKRLSSKNDERLDAYDRLWAKVAGAASVAAFLGAIIAKLLGFS